MGRLVTLGLPGSDGIHLPGVPTVLAAPDKLRELLDAHIAGAVRVDVLEEQLQVGVGEHRRAQPPALPDRTPEFILNSMATCVKIQTSKESWGPGRAERTKSSSPLLSRSYSVNNFRGSCPLWP